MARGFFKHHSSFIQPIFSFHFHILSIWVSVVLKRKEVFPPHLHFAHPSFSKKVCAIPFFLFFHVILKWMDEIYIGLHEMCGEFSFPTVLQWWWVEWYPLIFDHRQRVIRAYLFPFLRLSLVALSRSRGTTVRLYCYFPFSLPTFVFHLTIRDGFPI